MTIYYVLHHRHHHTFALHWFFVLLFFDEKNKMHYTQTNQTTSINPSINSNTKDSNTNPDSYKTLQIQTKPQTTAHY